MSGAAYLCTPGFEARVIEACGGRVVCPGLVWTPGPPADPAFGRQVLPDPRDIRGDSINALAREAAEGIAAVLDHGDAPWRLDVLVTDAPLDPNQPGELARRADLVGERIREALHKRRRRLARRLDPEADGALAQLLLIDRERALLSVGAAARLPCGAAWPAPFPGGRAPLAEEPDAPSRAYRKLREALAWMGEAPGPGQRCVDLGAAPGGWTHVAVDLGAEVLAIDRADLAPALMAHPNVEHRRGDAFRYEPEGPVDWLICDVIAAPERSLELVTRWAQARWFSRAVVHLKFKGAPPDGIVDQARVALEQAGYMRSRLKHLVSDRNEVTIMAR